MNASIITAFPELFTEFLRTSIPGRAAAKKLVGVNVINLRDFGKGNYRQLDDYAFGSGGMVFAAPQLKDALDFATAKFEGIRPYVVYPSPQGALISQETIETLASYEHVVIICGHYEGIDERFVQKYVDLEVSAGDFVLTGGEIPAMLIIDAMSRLVPGVVGKTKAVIEDSFYRGMLDNPNYTRPALWEGLEVPEVLTGGNEREISRWRRRESVRRTLTRRPDLVARASIREYVSGANIAVFAGNENVNLSGLPEMCEAYNLGRPYIIARTHELREAMKESYPAAKILGDIRRVYEVFGGGGDILTVKVSAIARKNSMHSLEAKRKCLEHGGNVLFVFAEDYGMIESLEGICSYLYADEVNIPLNVMIGAGLDRFLGKR
ncbi:MAG: tRNA (guanosine(37)-N1)-methyltransferase TrmD [Synergistaceae bacterium]|nr:tRNA (guanosine(37)-N1)-methyltransferase TrmD [Synergistaceae bacterium]